MVVESELTLWLGLALQKGEKDGLENYLCENSHLPGARMNIELVTQFANLIGQIVVQPEPPVQKLEDLLDGWAALPLAIAPVNTPKEILPCAAVRSYGQVAVVRPDWWDDEIAKLYKAAHDPRWRTREMVATALQAMLAADWERNYTALQEWLLADNPLVKRAVVSAVAEPALLKTTAKGSAALALMKQAVDWLKNLAPEQRKAEDVSVLVKALCYTISVATVASPIEGVAFLNSLAESDDTLLQRLAKENLKKKRLAKLK